MPALVSYWEGAILHFPLNQYIFTLPTQTYLHQPHDKHSRLIWALALDSKCRYNVGSVRPGLARQSLRLWISWRLHTT
jgi:hypothetical protein